MQKPALNAREEWCETIKAYLFSRHLVQFFLA